MRFLFHYPETHGSDSDMLAPGPLDEVASAAEAEGFDGFSLTEHPVPSARWLASGGHQSLDPQVALAFVAAATSRLRLLTYLAVAPYRNPMLLAKSAATVDKVSGGRFTLGIGAGYQKSEYYALGVDFEERNTLFDEALDVLPLHWSGQPFSYQGRHFDAREVVSLPRPVQDPIPIWIGGNSKLSRRRAAQRAQGWMPMPTSPELSATSRTAAIADEQQLAGMIREVQELAAEAGRPAVDVLWSYGGIWSARPDDDAERHRETIAGLEATGVTWVAITTESRSSKATIDFIEAFGATYLR
jgi:probable F420-dependent oxidoreductase